MPIPVTKYRCQFKCGSRAMGKLKEAEQHESICWHNPANRACTTCIHSEYSRHKEPYDESGFSEQVWWERHCSHPSGTLLLDDKIDTLYLEPNGRIKPLTDCPFWQPKQTH